MSIKIKYFYIPVFIISVIQVFGIIFPKSVFAITNNNTNIPKNITDSMEPAGSVCPKDKTNPPDLSKGQYDFAQYTWLSPKEAPKTVSNIPSISISSGTDRVNLWLNNLTLICNSNINSSGEIINKRWAFTKNTVLSSSTDYGTLHDLTDASTLEDYASAYDASPQLRYVTLSWPFYNPYHNDFYIDGLSGLSEGLHTITITANVRASHKATDDYGGNYACVNPGPGTRDPLISIDDSTCPGVKVTYELIINVLPPLDNPPTAVVTADCSNIYINSATDSNAPGKQIDYSLIYDGRVLATGTTIDGKATYNVAGKGVPIGRPILVGLTNFNPGKAKDNGTGFPGKAGWYPVTWPPPGTVCPNFKITDSPSIILDPVEDNESPKTATFKTTFKSVNPLTLGNIKVNKVAIKCTYKIVRYGVSTTDAGWPKYSSSNKDDASLDTTYDCDSETFDLPPNLRAGDKICLVRSATPGSGRVELSGALTIGFPVGAAYAPPEDDKCVTIVNKPYVSFYGADIRADENDNCEGVIPPKGINTNRNALGGSSTEFGAFALGEIFNNPTSGINPSLYFAEPKGNFGSYPNCWYAPFPKRPFDDQPTIPISIPNGTHGYGSAVTFKASTIAVNQKSYIYVYGDVNIIGDTEYSDTGWTDRSNIPSLYIYATGNINIAPSVTKLFGVYTAGGNFNTCNGVDFAENGVNSPVFDLCSSQLIVNGAVTAKKVNLQRTFGSLRNAADSTSCGLPAGSNCAAEIFDFNPMLFFAEAPSKCITPALGEKKYDFITTLPPFL
ncbi:MAG: hypothetical protein WCO19_04090 [Candidatus Saccharibacteria bacterium]